MANAVYYLSLQELSTSLRKGSLSPVTVVEETLARIERLNPKLNAFITVPAGQARAWAAQAEAEIKAGRRRGPLQGVPVGVKDMFDTAGIRTTAAFEYFKNRVPEEDAPAVSRLKEAGAVIIGKTNMHTLAMGTTSQVSFFGPVRNPWNIDYIAGGSSGGSAAAVASGLCYATIDSDGIGSCRLPAACCGVVGYKCTWGLLDNSGLLDGEKVDEAILKMATIGIMARSAGDAATVAGHLGGPSFTGTGPESEVPVRIGVVMNFAAAKSVRTAFDKAVSALRKIGYPTVEATAPLGERSDMRRVEEDRKTADEEIFKDAAVLVLPTLASEVPTARAVGRDPMALSPQNTFFANYYGLPAVSVPCGLDGNGLPIGLQMVGRRGQDRGLLEVAQAYQTATKWQAKHPIE